MNSITYWLLTIFIAIISFFVIRALSECGSYFQTEPRYYISFNTPKEMQPINI
jgi:hypothetical protein